MSKRDDREWDVIAGEFVLGTLSEREYKLYTNIYRHDVDFQERVTAWRKRFAPLDATVAPVEPDAGIWKSISRELQFTEVSLREAAGTPDSSFSADAADELSINLAGDMSSVIADKLEKGLNDSLNHSLDDSLDESLDSSHDHRTGNHLFVDDSADLSGDYSERFARDFDDTTGDFSSEHRPFPEGRQRSEGNIWRTVAGLATAAALVLAVLQWSLIRSSTPDKSHVTTGFLSLIVDEEETPLWLVDGASGTSQVRVIALQPPAIAEDKAHELWVVKPNDQGVSSLGLLPNRAGQTVSLPASSIAEDARAFAVSLETENGSTGDIPSGPVLYQGSWRTIQLGS